MPPVKVYTQALELLYVARKSARDAFEMLDNIDADTNAVDDMLDDLESVIADVKSQQDDAESEERDHDDRDPFRIRNSWNESIEVHRKS